LLNNDVSNEFFLLSSNRDAQWGISRCEVDLACPSEFESFVANLATGLQ
jgi:hypothetical protein